MPRPIPPFEAGTALLETIWYAYANRILEKAIQLYNVNEERQEDLRLKFGKRGDYVVRSTEDALIRKTGADES